MVRFCIFPLRNIKPPLYFLREISSPLDKTSKLIEQIQPRGKYLIFTENPQTPRYSHWGHNGIFDASKR